MRRFIVVAIAILAIALGYPAQSEVLIGVAAAMTGKLTWSRKEIERWYVLLVLQRATSRPVCQISFS
jgi:hypothetical protein